LVDMAPAKAAAFLGDVQRVARAVQRATGATGVNIFHNNGADAGQTVFHPHVHIVPRTAGDGLKLFPGNKGKISAEAAEPVQGKIVAVLNPPKKKKTAKFGQVGKVKPDSAGLNLKVKVVGECTEVSAKVGKFYEVLVGDDSGTVVLSLRAEQKECATKGATIELRNAAAKMVNGHVRLAVDKWGKVGPAEEPLEGDVDMDEKKNASATEYELVAGK